MSVYILREPINIVKASKGMSLNEFLKGYNLEKTENNVYYITGKRKEKTDKKERTQ